MQRLLAAIKAACKPSDWSRGEELSRAGCVESVREGEHEVEVRVHRPRGGRSPTVLLFPTDADWGCDCGSRAEACPHVAAGIVALHQAHAQGLSLARFHKKIATRVLYAFDATAEGLSLARFVVAPPDVCLPVVGMLAQADNAVATADLTPTDVDQACDAVLGGRDGILSPPVLQRTLALLVGADAVELDGRVVTVGEAQPVMRVRVKKHKGGLMLSAIQDPAIGRVFENGAILAGRVLRPLGELQVTSQELEALRRGQFVPREQVAQFATEVLPGLKARVPVDVVGVRLPKVAQLPPRLQFEAVTERRTTPSDDPAPLGMSLLPTLVYGDPPVARVEQGQLRQLGSSIPRRDMPLEAKLTTQLRQALGLEVGVRAVYRPAEAVAVVHKLKTLGLDVTGDGVETFTLSEPLQPRMTVGRKLEFSLAFESSSSDPKAALRSASAAAVIRAWQQGESMVPLLDGGFAPLPITFLEEHGHRVRDLLRAKDESDQLAPHALPDLARLCEALNTVAPPRINKLKSLLHDFTGLPKARLPADLTADLRDYQRQGVNWLCFVREAGMGAMLADDMGLGKTLQALCAIKGRTLVCAPTSVMNNWAQEIAKFRPALRCHIYHGSNRQLPDDVDVILTTYAIMRLDSEVLCSKTWDTIVLDEAQTIKSPSSQVAQAAYALKGKFRLTLTGTPVENRLDELWSQFHFINPGLLGGRQDFQERFARPMAEGVPGAAKRLQERVHPFMLRRLKTQVARELPSRTEVVLRCTLSAAERGVYDAVRAATMTDVVAKLQEGGSVFSALEALLRLRQACCHPALVPGQKAKTSSKIELLVETLQEAMDEDHKALVFSQWTGLLDLIEPHLRSQGIAFSRLDGSTRGRGKVVADFQADDGPPVMLVSLKAGGTGINLTAADHVFLVDPWWNPAVEDQAADRAHRIGQTRPVLVHRLVAEDTVEERILLLQGEKRAIAQAALEGSDRGASLTRDDLLALLS